MSWAKIDDNFAEHPKIVALNDRAFRVHVRGILYANRLLTDGVVPAAVAHQWSRAGVRDLVSVALWAVGLGGDYLIHDYLEWNESAEDVRGKKEVKRIAGAMGAATRWGHGKDMTQGVEWSKQFKTVTTQPGVGSQKTQRQRLLLKAYEALPADVLYPGGEQLSDSDAIAAYLQQRNGATAS